MSAISVSLTTAKENLERTLDLMESVEKDELNSTVDLLIEQKIYTEVKLKKSYNQYYSKQLDSYMHNSDIPVFIKGRTKEGTRYRFAKVKLGKLEEFCKRFDKYSHRKETNQVSSFGLVLGATTGGTAAYLGEKIYYTFAERVPHISTNPLSTSPLSTSPLEQTAILIILGLFAGAMLGVTLYDSITSIRNVKKWNKCYSLLELDDKKALKLAFGGE